MASRGIVIPPAGEWTGNQLRVLRKRLGWTQGDAGKFFGVRPSSIEKWEYGNISLCGYTGLGICRLLDYLDENPQMFFEGGEDESTNAHEPFSHAEGGL